MLGLGLVLGAVTVLGAGRLLVRVDPIDPATPADAIYVLGGSRSDRWLEAVELYKAGAARHIVMSRGGTEPAERLLAARGITGFGEILRLSREKSPLKRNTEAQEVGDTALFLFSHLSRGITGQVLYVDSGYNIIGF